MRCCLCCQHQLKMFQSLCIFLPWPHSTLPPKFLLLQLLVCCKSDQGAELVLTSASLFGLFCWGWVVFFFFPWSGVVHSAAAGKNCAGTTKRTMWSGLGGEAEVLLPFISENTTELLSRAAFCCMRHDCWKPHQRAAHPILTLSNCSSRHC